ncbi:MAG TPA: SigE family RNA polymerase sigma factor [Motilibacteraceae bacterium]|nr:SigE family RNA polymerase sigma factor [Motilibacteraceae bacterium]
MRHESARDGRDGEFADFLTASGRSLLQLARLLTGDHHAGEDLLQAALVRTYLHWGRVEDPHAYVRRALLNGARDRWRRRRWREVPLTPDDGPPPVDPADHHDVAGRQADRDGVLRALRTLTDKERRVVVLRYYEDLSESAIADLLGVAPGTVKSTAARALRKLAGSPHLLPYVDEAPDGLPAPTSPPGGTR